MTGVDISGELRDLADSVQALERELADTQNQLAESAKANEQLQLELDEAVNAMLFAESDVEVYELLADLKRGLLTIDEVLERTVGR